MHLREVDLFSNWLVAPQTEGPCYLSRMRELSDERLQEIIDEAQQTPAVHCSAEDLHAIAIELRRRRQHDITFAVLTIGVGVACGDEHWQLDETNGSFTFTGQGTVTGKQFETQAPNQATAVKLLIEWRTRALPGQQVTFNRVGREPLR